MQQQQMQQQFMPVQQMQTGPQIAPIHVYVGGPSPLTNVCYFEGCNNPGDYYCSTPDFDKECGCRKRFCIDHKSKKTFVRVNRGLLPDVCINCEDKAHKRTKCFYAIFGSVYFCILACFAMFIIPSFLGHDSSK